MKQSSISVNGCFTKVKLNILPLGSYDLLICMDWLEKHGTIIKFLEKNGKLCKSKGKNLVNNRYTETNIG